MSGVTCNFFLFYFFLQSVGASLWRVCYQRGLPRLVYKCSGIPRYVCFARFIVSILFCFGMKYSNANILTTSLHICLNLSSDIFLISISSNLILLRVLNCTSNPVIFVWFSTGALKKKPFITRFVYVSDSECALKI